MAYTYNPNGTLIIGGCILDLEIDRDYYFIYDVGSVAYVLSSALKGELEKVVIKTVNIIDPIRLSAYNYQDTFNRIWLEDELTSSTNARAIVTEYWEDYDAAEARLDNCIR